MRLRATELEVNRQIGCRGVYGSTNRLARLKAERFLTHSCVVLGRKNDVKAVAEGIKNEKAIRDGHHDNHGVIKGPLYVSDVLSNEAPLCQWLEFVYLIWISGARLLPILSRSSTRC